MTARHLAVNCAIGAAMWLVFGLAVVAAWGWVS